jgi:hypothetical protein
VWGHKAALRPVICREEGWRMSAILITVGRGRVINLWDFFALFCAYERLSLRGRGTKKEVPRSGVKVKLRIC